MPPVFGPVSPSPTRLWSCARAEREHVLAVDQREQARLLALQALLDHDRAAGRAEGAAERLRRARASASSTVAATVTPLPAASPSALITIGAPAART